MRVSDFQGRILILDYGSQYTQLIARRVREAQVYCEIHPFHMSLEAIRAFQPKGIILSGGPASVYEARRAREPAGALPAGHPHPGDLLRHAAHDPRAGRESRSFQQAGIRPERALHRRPGGSFRRPERAGVHSGVDEPRGPDRSPPSGFPGHRPFAQFSRGGHEDRGPWRPAGVQFHPEVVHTPLGKEILHNFLFRICQCPADWTMESFVARTVRIPEGGDRRGDRSSAP